MVMGTPNFSRFIWLSISILCKVCLASTRNFGKISPGFQGSQMYWIDNDGLFLLSNNSKYGFGFVTTEDVTKFLLAVIHMGSSKVVWSANRGFPVSNADNFTFDEKGNALLQRGSAVVWSTDTTGKGVSAMELQNSGNLVLRGNDDGIVWESFRHPADTLLAGQDFIEGMRLVSNHNNNNNLSYYLEMKFGDMTLSAGFRNPQPYWSMARENRKTINKDGGAVTRATLEANSWRFYDQSNVLLWQFIFSSNADGNGTWIAVLGNDGFISFYNLQDAGSSAASPITIPGDSCSTPEPCGPYFICYSVNKCQCPSVLSSYPNCQSGIVLPCDHSKGRVELVNAGTRLDYFALEFLPYSSKTDLNGCKNSCMSNCSCRAMFFESSTGNCFLLDDVGSFRNSDEGSDLVSYIKVMSKEGSGDSNTLSENGGINSHIVVIIAVFTVLVICGLVYLAFYYYRKKKRLGTPRDSSEDEFFLNSLSGAPIRYSYIDLQTATNNFSMKLGQGGFGSVYQGVLADGTRLAVKKLESIGQGKKEFRAEVSIIGSVHHVHLVRLKGFCAEGTHKLLAYEYMANGSLDKWIFRKNKEDFLLDWNTRFNIALGTAKGLAYLHEDCDVKIIHCDIKPENVLLDDKFLAKVSDFGLAKLMTREQSHVFTTMRGTRGYLAPEWITNYAISEKSDVYSYGMVLLEIIGGRKNYDTTETSEKCHFPSYAFKMLEEGKLQNILDSNLTVNEGSDKVITAIKVALWCIQEDMHLRPPMTKVVQMLEGLCAVPIPPTCSPLGSRLYSGFIKSTSEAGTSSGPSECNSDAFLSAVRLSGPR